MTEMRKLAELTVQAEAKRLKEVRYIVLTTALGCGCSHSVAMDVVLASDEACQNIIRHAYGGSGEGEIVVEIYRQADDLVVLLRDFAPPVDTTKVKPRDLDDLRPGGLGTHFIREVLDVVEFLPPPSGKGNLLKLVKRIA